MITSHMHIKAPGFPRHPRDDELVNNFMSGFAVAEALSTELGERGYTGLQVIDEDYGWLVVARPAASDVELSIAVSSLAEHDADASDVVELMVAIQPQKLTKGMFWWKRDIAAEVRDFSETVFGFLRDTSGIEGIEVFSDIR